MAANTAVKTAGWVTLNWVCEVFGLMADCRDGKVVMLLFAAGATWVYVRAAKRTLNYISVNWVEWMIGYLAGCWAEMKITMRVG